MKDWQCMQNTFFQTKGKNQNEHRQKKKEIPFKREKIWTFGKRERNNRPDVCFQYMVDYC